MLRFHILKRLSSFLLKWNNNISSFQFTINLRLCKLETSFIFRLEFQTTPQITLLYLLLFCNILSNFVPVKCDICVKEIK